MKKKIGEIYNKPIVIGDKNLVTKNEMHVSKLNASTGGGGAIEYLDLRGYDLLNDSAITGVVSVSLLWNALNNNVSLIGPVPMITSVIQGNLEKLLACAVDFSVSLSMGPETLTAKDFLLQSSASEEAIASIPRLTKEEFYNLNSSDNSGESTVNEGDLIYYTFNDIGFNSIRNITDNITQIAVGRGESMSTASIVDLNRFIDIQDVTINKGEDYVSISIPNVIVVDMPAFVYKVGSDLKTAEDIIGNSSITRITKDEYDNIFNM